MSVLACFPDPIWDETFDSMCIRLVSGSGNDARIQAVAVRLQHGYARADVPPSTVIGFAHRGNSGSGKSWTWDRMLSLYPQVIEHPRRVGRPSSMQLVWLLLEIPQDGSLKRLCINILQGVDEMLGTAYAERYTSDKPALRSLISRVEYVLANHELEVLVLEEVERLRIARSGGCQDMTSERT